MIIHRITGKPWHEFVRERILEPLNMAETRLVRVGESGPKIAKGHRWSRNELIGGYPIAQSILSYPGGGLVSTVRDMAKWDAALYVENPLKQPLLAEMWTPATFNNGKRSGYGFGFGIGEYRGHRRVGHNGGHSTGFTSTYTRFPEEKLAVVVLINQRANSDNIALGVAQSFLPSPEGKAARAAKLR
jgi:CubicO group peptidase (beta-lactamase class C family)